jgi:hypothetical protein
VRTYHNKKGQPLSHALLYCLYNLNEHVWYRNKQAQAKGRCMQIFLLKKP